MKCPYCGAEARKRKCEYCGSELFTMEELQRMENPQEEIERLQLLEESSDLSGIKELTTRFCRKFPEYFSCVTISHGKKQVTCGNPKVNNKLYETLGLGQDDEEIYLIHDDTLLKTGTNGFAITKGGFYYRGLFNSVTIHTSWKELAKANTIGFYQNLPFRVCADEVTVAYFSGDKVVQEALLKLVKTMALLYQQEGDDFLR